MSRCSEAELLSVCSEYTGVRTTDIPIQKSATEDYLNNLPRWSVIAFRPCISAFYRKLVPFKRIIVTTQALNGSPWASCLIESNMGDFSKPTTLSYLAYSNTKRLKFDPAKLKAKASLIYKELREIPAVKDYEHGTTGNAGAVMQGKCNGNTSQVVATPPFLLETLHKVFAFDCDPCPIFPDKDAMTSAWGRMNYVNPPFKHTAAFCFRAAELAIEKGSKTVIICPATIRSVWRQELHKTGTVHAYIFLRSGITFEGYKKAMPLPLNLILIGEPRNLQEVPVFFWDAVKNDKRLKPSLFCDSPPDLTAIGW